MDATLHPSLLKRKIIHMDMDAFFVAIEMRDRPELKGKPVVVGGSPNGRGVVATASYEARRYGVRSAMSCAKAQRLCPELIFVGSSFDKYRKVSGEIREIMSRYTDKMEMVSIDEAYLDVTGQQFFPYASELAKHIKGEIFEKTGLSASAGVGPNKMIAKIASDFNKPDGLTVVAPENVERFMMGLPLAKINGVGPVSAGKLKRYGMVTCEDVLNRSEQSLREHFGSRFASWIYRRAQGLDDREVGLPRERKSIGRERTFGSDKSRLEELRDVLEDIAQDVSQRAKRHGCYASTITLKYRHRDFQTFTRAKTVSEPTRDANLIAQVAGGLLTQNWSGTPLRLLGITLSGLCFNLGGMRPLFAE